MTIDEGSICMGIFITMALYMLYLCIEERKARWKEARSFKEGNKTKGKLSGKKARIYFTKLKGKEGLYFQ